MSTKQADIVSMAGTLAGWAGYFIVLNIADVWGTPSSTVTVTVGASTSPSGTNTSTFVHSKAASATWSSTGFSSGSGVPFDGPAAAARNVALAQALEALSQALIAAGATFPPPGTPLQVG
jgi:hypothetical protein